MNKKKMKQKTIMIEEDLSAQIESLCNVMNTNFTIKSKELLLEWKIREIKRLKEDAPDIYQEYEAVLKSIKS